MNVRQTMVTNLMFVGVDELIIKNEYIWISMVKQSMRGPNLPKQRSLSDRKCNLKKTTNVNQV